MVKIVKSEVCKDGNDILIEIEVEKSDETSYITIGKRWWSLDTSNLKQICQDTLDLIKENEAKSEGSK